MARTLGPNGSGLPGRAVAAARVALATLGALLVLGLTLSSVGSPARFAGAAPREPSVPGPAPLATAWTTAQGSWAVVAMGRLDRPLDTFWEVLFRAAGAGRWSLVTPPAVADNGGLVADQGPGEDATVGFVASQKLMFSPLARTADGGRTWAPGLLPSGLLRVPDAVAGAPGGSLVALVRSAGGSLLRSKGSLDSWGPLVGRSRLAASAGATGCGVVALRAAAVTSGGVPEIGTACTKAGVVGVFDEVGGSWVRTGPRLTGASGRMPTSVLRLQSGASGTAVLVQAGVRSHAVLSVLWRLGPGSPWSQSSPLRLEGPLVSTAFGTGNTVAVVSGEGADLRAAVSAPGGPRSPWRALPALPAETAAISVGPSGSFDALAVHTKALVDWRLVAAGTGWGRGSTLVAPLQFGSST